MAKSLVIIGASSDMGTALLETYGSVYSNIVVHFRSMNRELSTALKNLGEKNIIEIQADFSDAEIYDTVSESFKMIAQDLADTEIHLVHFPALPCNNNRFHKISWETFQKEIDVSLKSFVVAAQCFLPVMAKAQSGKIIVMLSYLTENIPPKYCSNYVTIKYALTGLMKALAVEYADKGITVNGVSPATVDTKYISNMPEVLLNAWNEKSPLGRNLHVDEVVPAITFLLSDAANCINGENILISCGMQAH